MLYGALYGLVLWLAMLWLAMLQIAVSLSANQSAPWAWVIWANIAARMFLVGVPCAFGARWALRQDQASSSAPVRQRNARNPVCA